MLTYSLNSLLYVHNLIIDPICILMFLALFVLFMFRRIRLGTHLKVTQGLQSTVHMVVVVVAVPWEFD
jgi:F0F1-type ATP synthase membrane subunit a